MPVETTLHPSGQPRKNAVVVEPPMTRYQALRQINFFSPLDFLVLFLLIGFGVTMIFWKIFAQPSFEQLMVCFFICFGLLQVWVISLVYRCMHFVIMLQAYVNTLPEHAARLVMTAYSGGVGGGKQP